MRDYVSTVPFRFNKKKSRSENWKMKERRKKLGNILKFTIDRIFIHSTICTFASRCLCVCVYQRNIFKNKIGFGDNFQMYSIVPYSMVPIIWIIREIDKWIVFCHKFIVYACVCTRSGWRLDNLSHSIATTMHVFAYQMINAWWWVIYLLHIK